MLHSANINNLLHFVLLSLIFLMIYSEGSELGNNGRIARSVPYDGEWDISGKHTAMLCEVVKRNQADDDDGSPIPEPEKDSYTKDDQCWKNQWIPCENQDADDRLGTDGVLANRRKPCGHYKMVSASDC